MTGRDLTELWDTVYCVHGLFNLSSRSRIKIAQYQELYRTNFAPENNKHLYRELLLAHHMPQLSQYYLGSLYGYDFLNLFF